MSERVALALVASVGALACSRAGMRLTPAAADGAPAADAGLSADARDASPDLPPPKDLTAPDAPPDVVPPDTADPAVPVCGNGELESWEACDDGNAGAGDGCSGDCRRVESGFHCTMPARPCTPTCGDRYRVGTETCDDGNLANGDGCSELCLVEPGWECPRTGCVPAGSYDGGADASGPVLYCGDGIRSGAEECDDGPANGNPMQSGCSHNCHYTNCGDGMVDGPEECDLGPANRTLYGDPSGCTPWCMAPGYCGDGVVDGDYEMCDLGPYNGQSHACESYCMYFIN